MPQPPRTLVIGWFTFEQMGATAGDFIAADLLGGWLREAGVRFDVAVSDPARAGAFTRNAIATAAVEPGRYAAVVFVCGPVADGPPLNAFLGRFPQAKKFALNVSLLQERRAWDPFVHAVERDSAARARPDITFAAAAATAPVVGLIYIPHQPEYRHRHADVERMVAAALAGRDVAAVSIDTQLDPPNRFGLRTPAQVESVIARMDAVITTRLHGLALALRRGVPAVAIDSVPGGAKVLAQARRVGWPLALDVAEVTPETIGRALDRALAPQARADAAACAARAAAEVAEVRREFMSHFLAATRE